MHSIMVKYIFRPRCGQKRKKIDIVAKSYPLWQAVKMHRYGSLISINPSGRRERRMRSKGYVTYAIVCCWHWPLNLIRTILVDVKNLDNSRT